MTVKLFENIIEHGVMYILNQTEQAHFVQLEILVCIGLYRFIKWRFRKSNISIKRNVCHSFSLAISI